MPKPKPDVSLTWPVHEACGTKHGGDVCPPRGSLVLYFCPDCHATGAYCVRHYQRGKR
jgi:hypothetical protein